MRRLVAVACLLLLPAAAWAAPRVAVQPFGSAATEPYRAQVAKLIRRHGFKVVTSLPAVSGTGQYPGLAKEKALNAFVVADADERGERVILSFLVWQGVDGSVIARWEVAATRKQLGSRIAREFWRRLGPAISRARAPFSDELPPAPTMRINAGPSERATPVRRKKVRPSGGGSGPKPMAVSL